MSLWPIPKFTAAVPTLLPLLGVLLAPTGLQSGRLITSAEMYGLLNRHLAEEVTAPAAHDRVPVAVRETDAAPVASPAGVVSASWQLTDLVWVADGTRDEVRLLR
ncbi:MAG: hypothetical protein KDI36_13370 [Pseudomonadales bacterium]|nr:hypothetical protein [Pseudomonadales bacterium]